MEMTFLDYTQNPMGRKNAVFSQRDMYRNIYTEKLDRIMVRENGKITYFLYTNKDDYIAHIKVPSEVVPNFYYDVIVRMFSTTDEMKKSRNLEKYNVQFYSNDPAFVFTFAHAFLKNDIFFKDLTTKMSSQALKHVASERNPSDEVGYVKSLYFAYLIMKSRGLFNKVLFESEGNAYNKAYLLSTVEDADIKVAKRKEEGEKIEKQNRKKTDTERRTVPVEKPINKEDNQPLGFLGFTNKISNISRTKITPRSRKSSMRR